MLNFKQVSVASALALGVVLSANAATETTTFQVKIKITESCTIKGVTATDVDFGAHARSADVPDAQGKLVVNCSNGTPFTVGLNNGANASGSDQRNMKLGSTNNVIAYNLYQDASRNVAWGNTGAGLLSGNGTGSDLDVPVYGRVPANSTNVPAGDYVDTVTATLTY